MPRAFFHRPLALVVALVPFAADALEGLPPSVNPPGVTDKVHHTWSWDRYDFQVAGKRVTKIGKHTEAELNFLSGHHEKAAGTWAAWRPVLEQAGWKVVDEDHDTHTLRHAGREGDVFLEIALGDYAEPKLTVVEPARAPAKLNLPKPAATPEQVGDQQEWPYLPAYPGAHFHGTVKRDDLFPVRLPGSEENTFVAKGYVLKEYQPPPTLSRYEVESVMRDALARAGWDVVPSDDPSMLKGEVVAHYSKSGREIWLWINRGADDSGEGLTYAVVDLGGSEAWAKELQKSCRVTLRGVTFDFNQATLRPESAGVLANAAAALKKAAIKIEVQGHTDNVGDDAYNARLSTQRAEAVRAWLVGHGVAAERLSAKGYGKSVPVASNDTDAGRAQNRRVELTCAK